jgi:hypothetical protein
MKQLIQFQLNLLLGIIIIIIIIIIGSTALHEPWLSSKASSTFPYLMPNPCLLKS